MVELIDQFFANHLGVGAEEAERLHQEYYRHYGLAIEGLVEHHQIDPLEYNRLVDDALPLEDIIRPDPRLRALLADLDTRQVRPWLLTNAYVTHARRVVRLLEVEDRFEGLTYCDYAKIPIVCKPHKDMYARAMREAGVERTEDCYFVGKFFFFSSSFFLSFFLSEIRYLNNLSRLRCSKYVFRIIIVLPL